MSMTTLERAAVAVYAYGSTENRLVVTCTPDNRDEWPIAWTASIEQLLASNEPVGTRYALNVWHYGELLTII